MADYARAPSDENTEALTLKRMLIRGQNPLLLVLPSNTRGVQATLMVAREIDSHYCAVVPDEDANNVAMASPEEEPVSA